MTTKECPSCAMEIDARNEVCPICRYEFPKRGRGLQWITIILIILLLLYFIWIG